mgnify:CR=1 FL=1
MQNRKNVQKDNGASDREDGQVTVRVPRTVTEAQAEEFARRHGEWILKTRKRVLQNASWRRSYTEAEKQTGKQRLSRKLEERLPLFASVMGVSYGRVSIRDQRTRWGSCSGKGNLNFNWKLSLVPDEILDYVVVHELAHRIEMNHSAKFLAGGGENSAGLQKAEDVAEGEWRKALGNRKAVEQARFNYVLGR